MSCSGTKRKADDITSESNKKAVVLNDAADVVGTAEPAVTCMSLPVPIWTRILEYLSFADIRSAMLLSRTIAFDAATQIKELFITHVSDLNVAFMKKRTWNTATVDIPCLLYNCSVIEHGGRSFELDHGAVGRIVPFLLCFPKLECVVLGGPMMTNDERWDYSVNVCRGPTDHESIYKSLLYSFGGAFASKSLKLSICLDGVIGRFKKYNCDQASCVHCRYILQHFPLSTIICCFGKCDGYERNDFCIPDEEVCAIIKKRKWTDDCKQSANKEVLSHMLSSLLICNYAHISLFKDRVRDNALAEWMATDNKYMRYLPMRNLRRLEFLREIGCHVLPLGKDYWKNKNDMMYVFDDVDWRPGDRLLFPRDAFDRLVNIGYSLQEEDFVLVNDPALRSFDFVEHENECLIEFPDRTVLS